MNVRERERVKSPRREEEGKVEEEKEKREKRMTLPGEARLK